VGIGDEGVDERQLLWRRSLADAIFQQLEVVANMNISSAKVDELARLTGEDVETALERAVEERLSRVAAAAPKDREAALRKFFDRVSQMPIKDDSSIDEIVGYGPDGLPS
jgi:antitoxin VapB